MDATMESPMLLHDELRALRERAYGPHADIGQDPVALARLTELEQWSHPTPTAEPRAESETAGIEPASSDQTSTDALPRVEAPATVTVSPPPPPARRRRLPSPIRWAIALALAIAGVVALGAAVAMPHPLTILAQTPGEPDLTTIDESLGEFYRLIPAGLQAYDTFGPIEVWTSVSDSGRECLFVGVAGEYHDIACTPPGLDPVVDVQMKTNVADVIGTTDLRIGSLVRLIMQGDTVEVWVAHPPERGGR